VDVTVHNLITAAISCRQVGDASFKAGDLLRTPSTRLRDSNGLFILELKSGRTIALDNDAKNYNRLTWNDTGTARRAKGRASTRCASART
jgi:hypothetical protein